MSDGSSQIQRDSERDLRNDQYEADFEIAKRARTIKKQLDDALMQLEGRGYTIELSRNALRIAKEL